MKKSYLLKTLVFSLFTICVQSASVSAQTSQQACLTRVKNFIPLLFDIEGSFEQGPLNGFGFGEKWLFGKGDHKQNSFTQDMLRGITNSLYGDKLRKARSAIELMPDNLREYLSCVDKYPYRISVFERPKIYQSIRMLSLTTVDDLSAHEAVIQLRNALQFYLFRARSNIEVIEFGFETISGANVITYRGKNRSIYYQQVLEPTIYVPDWIGPEGITDSLRDIPAGSQVYYNGKLYTKGPDANK